MPASRMLHPHPAAPGWSTGRWPIYGLLVQMPDDRDGIATFAGTTRLPRGANTLTIELERPPALFGEGGPSVSCRCYSGSVGSLNSTVNLMPCPNCGKLLLLGSAGSRFDAVSSGGNSTSEFRKTP